MAQLSAMMKTKDGVYRVHVYEGQTAELRGPMGLVVKGRLHRVTDRLAKLGYAWDDLVES